VFELEASALIVATALKRQCRDARRRDAPRLGPLPACTTNRCTSTDWRVHEWSIAAQAAGLARGTLESGGPNASYPSAATSSRWKTAPASVHVAKPAFGGEDFDLGKANGLLFSSRWTCAATCRHGSPWPRRRSSRMPTTAIMEDLTARASSQAPRSSSTRNPFCWRCGTPLLISPSRRGTSHDRGVKDSLIAGTTGSTVPEHIKNGASRYGCATTSMAVSRERYWARPCRVEMRLL